MFDISEFKKLFNKKNRCIVSQNNQLNLKDLEIEDLKEKLVNSKCYVKQLQEINENKSKHLVELTELRVLYDSLKAEYNRVEDWANSRPVFVE